MQELNSINTFLFADETKFSINDNYSEDLIFYFALSTSKAEEKKFFLTMEKLWIILNFLKNFIQKKYLRKKILIKICRHSERLC